MKSNTTAALKLRNQQKIFLHIYKKENTTKQEIATQLDMSLPTVGQNLKDLEEAGLILRDGYQDSTGGRKAFIIRCNSVVKIAIGVELLRDHIEIIACDLYGSIIRSDQLLLPFSYDTDYILAVCHRINAFIDSIPVPSEQILGIGIVIQGLVSANGSLVSYGEILNCTGMTIQSFQDSLNYPCIFLHDGESAAFREIWKTPNLPDTIYFHIRETLSGSVIVNGSFLKGRELKSGIFEHMILIPNGRPCYCGKNGCVESYCSLNALLECQETPAQFFQKLRIRNTLAVERWRTYLEHLASAIDNLRMLMDCDVILGGTLAQYLIEEDIDTLLFYVRSKSTFPSSRKFIHISKCVDQPVALGGGLYYIKNYLDTFIPGGIVT